MKLAPLYSSKCFKSILIMLLFLAVNPAFARFSEKSSINKNSSTVKKSLSSNRYAVNGVNISLENNVLAVKVTKQAVILIRPVNLTGATTTNSTISFSLPSGYSYVSSSILNNTGSSSYNSATGIWTMPIIPQKADTSQITLRIVANVLDNPVDANYILNTTINTPTNTYTKNFTPGIARAFNLVDTKDVLFNAKSNKKNAAGFTDEYGNTDERTQLYKITSIGDEYSFEVYGANNTKLRYNALALNPQDGFMYAMGRNDSTDVPKTVNNLYIINPDGKPVLVKTYTNLQLGYNSTSGSNNTGDSMISGEITPNGSYYLRGADYNDEYLSIVDLNTYKIKRINLPSTFPGTVNNTNITFGSADLASWGDWLYTILYTGEAMRININTDSVQNLGRVFDEQGNRIWYTVNNPPNALLSFKDSFGAFYGNSINGSGFYGSTNLHGGRLYKFFVKNDILVGRYLANIGEANNNDGAHNSALVYSIDSDVTIDITTDANCYSAGNMITYTVVLTNHGPSNVYDATVNFANWVTGADRNLIQVQLLSPNDNTIQPDVMFPPGNPGTAMVNLFKPDVNGGPLKYTRFLVTAPIPINATSDFEISANIEVNAEYKEPLDDSLHPNTATKAVPAGLAKNAVTLNKYVYCLGLDTDVVQLSINPVGSPGIWHSLSPAIASADPVTGVVTINSAGNARFSFEPDLMKDCPPDTVELRIRGIRPNPVPIIERVADCINKKGDISIQAPIVVGATYLIRDVDGNPYRTILPSQANALITDMDPGNYFLSLAEDATYCETSGTAFTIAGPPTPPSPPTLINKIEATCISAGSIQINSPIGAMYTYRLFFEENSAPTAFPVTSSATPFFNNLEPGRNYVVRVIDNNSCESSNSAVINMLPLKLPVISAIGSTLTCWPGGTLGSITVTVDPTTINSTDILSYELSDINNSNPPVIQNNNIFTNLPAGTYSIILRNITTICPSNIVTVTISNPVNPPTPILELSSGPSCDFQYGDISVISPNPDLEYTIYDSNLSLKPYPANSVTFGNLRPGTYYVRARDKNTNCESLLSDGIFTFAEEECPSITLEKTGSISNENQDEYADVDEHINYEFRITNTGNVTLTNINLVDFVFDVNISVSNQHPSPFTLVPGQSFYGLYIGSYKIKQDDLNRGYKDNTAEVSGTTASGRTVTSESSYRQALLKNPNCKITVYNTLTPNTDDHNNFFRVEGLECYAENTVKIFNRWGVLVYEKSGYNNTDVVFRGISEGRFTVSAPSKLPTGVYFYTIKYKDSKAVWHTKSGSIYLSL